MRAANRDGAGHAAVLPEDRVVLREMPDVVDDGQPAGPEHPRDLPNGLRASGLVAHVVNRGASYHAVERLPRETEAGACRQSRPAPGRALPRTPRWRASPPRCCRRDPPPATDRCRTPCPSGAAWRHRSAGAHARIRRRAPAPRRSTARCRAGSRASAPSRPCCHTPSPPPRIRIRSRGQAQDRAARPERRAPERRCQVTAGGMTPRRTSMAMRIPAAATKARLRTTRGRRARSRGP